MPQNAAGRRMDPPVSEPIDAYPRPAATAAAEPLLEPLVPYSRFQGFRLGPNVGHISPYANSSMLALPTRIAPAVCSLRTTVASTFGICSASILDPAVVRTPRVRNRSLTEIGTPWSGPRYWPRAICDSATRAARMAASAVTVMKAFS